MEATAFLLGSLRYTNCTRVRVTTHSLSLAGLALEPRAARRLPRHWTTEHMLGAQTWADDGRTTALGLTGIARGFTDVVHCKFSLLHAPPQTSPPPQCIKGFFFGN